MSSTSRYPLTGDRVPTNIVNNEQPPSYGGILNVEEWLKKAKLYDYHSIFMTEKITIEELLSFTEDELLSITTETLSMNVLHRRRFMEAMRETKQNINIFSHSSPDLIKYGSATQSSISASSSSSKSSSKSTITPIITRPLSPAHSIHSTQSSPDTKKSKTYNIHRINGNNFAGFNDNTPSTQSPLITTNYNSHRYNYRRAPLQPQILQTIPSQQCVVEMNGNGNDKSNDTNNKKSKCKKRNSRFGEERKRRHSTSETDMISDINNINNNIQNMAKLIINKSTPNSMHGSSSNSINDIDELESCESSEYNDSAPHSAQSTSRLTLKLNCNKIKSNNIINKNKPKTPKTPKTISNNNNNHKKKKRNRDKSRSNSTVTMRNKKKKMNKRKLINNNKKKKKVKFAVNGDRDNRDRDNLNDHFLGIEDMNYKRSKTYDSALTPQRDFKITRTSSRNTRNMISSTPTLTSIKSTIYSPSQISQLSRISNSYHSNSNIGDTSKSIHIIFSEEEQHEDSENNNNERATITNIIGSDSNTNTNHLSHPSMPRMLLISSGDDEQRENKDNDDDMSSNNDIHSEDEKWEELERNMTIEEKQNMKTISVLLQENKADSNQIENGIKILNNNYTECERDIKQHFDTLHIKLKEKNMQILQSLIKVKNGKQEVLDKKILKLQENKKHILKQKYLCDQLLNNDNNNDNNQRQQKIAELKDIAMNINNNNNNNKGDGDDDDDDDDFNINDDDIHDLKEYESKIEIDFNTEQRDLFYNNICIIKQCTIPHPPKIRIKMTTFTSITLKIVIMSTKEKKAIQHHPFNNESKNNRIYQIQIECVQSKSPDIQYIYAEFDKLNHDKHDNHDDDKKNDDNKDNTDNIDNIGSSASRSSPSRSPRRTKRKLKVKKNNKKKRRKSRKDKDINNNDSELEEESDNKENNGNIHLFGSGTKDSYSYSYSFDQNDGNDTNQNEKEKKNGNNKRRVKRIVIDENAKLKRIHIITFNGLLTGHYCYIRARTKNVNGWSRYCQAIHTQLPISTNLKFDIDKNDKIKYLLDNKCTIFQNTKQHQIAVINKLIDKKEYNLFEWKCIIDFDVKKTNNKKDTIHINEDSKNKQGICMGFISYPLSECMDFNNIQLGTNGTQYGLFVTNNSRSAHAYFTRDGSIHHTSSIMLKHKVLNGDQFKISCNMKRGKCDIYHNQEMLMDVFNSRIPNKIIPALSAHVINGSISCKIDFVSSN